MEKKKKKLKMRNKFMNLFENLNFMSFFYNFTS